MAPSDIIQVRVCLQHLRQIFNAKKMAERAEQGEFLIKYGEIRPRDLEDDYGNHITGSQMVYYYDPANLSAIVGRAHRYVTDKGETGASGRLDPKQFTLGGFDYRQIREKGIASLTTCAICSGEHPDPAA